MSMKTIATLPAICCGPTAQPLSEPESEELAGRFKALADPTRVAIVNRLSQADEVCVCDLNAAFDLSQPTISHHLKILKEAGLVQALRRGSRAFYRLHPATALTMRWALGGRWKPTSPLPVMPVRLELRRLWFRLAAGP